MKMLIAIPSYNRPYNIEKRTGHWIKKIKNADVKVFVCPNQYLYYSQVIPQDMLIKGAVQGEKEGFINQLLFIKKYAEDHGYDVVFKCDDDMTFTKSKAKKDQHGELIDEAILEFKFTLSSDPSINAISFSQPMEYLYSEKKGFKKRKKAFSGAYIIRTNKWILHKDLYCYDDIFSWIELKINDQANCWTYYGLMQDALCGTNEGGLQSIDRNMLGKKTYKNCVKYYPNVVPKEDTKHKFFDIDYSYYKKNSK